MKLPFNFNFKERRIIQNEENASKHINVLAHYDDDTLLDKSGKLIKIIKLSGLNYFTKDEQTLKAYKNRRNNLFKNFSSHFACYTWQIRRKINNFPNGEFVNVFAKEVNGRYKQKIETGIMFHTEHYIALMTKPPEGLINKGFSFLSHTVHRFDKQAKKEYLHKQHRELNEITRTLLSVFSDYNCEVLGAYEKQDIKFSASLSFLSQIINFDKSLVPLKIIDAATILPRKRLFFNSRSGTIEMRSADGKQKFAAVLSIKAYCPRTVQGMLDQLNTLQCEYVVTQSFRFYDRQVAKGRLRDQQFEMGQSNEESISQTEQIDEAFDETASGDVGYGKHHFTLVCYGDTQEELDQHIAIIVSGFTDVDITVVREDIACELSFWAQLPGNFSYICRPADISTQNFASFVSFHNTPLGKLTGNHWGDAVTVFETIDGSPYYFNFHYKDVGNFLVFGSTGSGKTLLIGFLILQSLKFGGKRIIFDKDRGLEILVSTTGGVYERIKPGIKTGFNPCHLNDTPENRKFLSALFKKMLTINGEILTESDVAIIERAVDGLYRMDDMVSRQLCHLAPYFGASKPGSLRARFDQWHSDGAHAWLFDNDYDSLNLGADVIGFDIGHILADKECKAPALMYMLHRIEKALEGACGMVFIDEGWRALEDDDCKQYVNDSSRIQRKKNNIFGFATQAANDTMGLGNSKAINESAFCKIFFPNSGADRAVYVDEFGLSEHEYHLVKTLPDDQHYFLLVHGRSTNKESVVLRLNLKELEDLIAVISANEETLKLLDELLVEVSKDPQIWLPLFLEQTSGGQP